MRRKLFITGIIAAVLAVFLWLPLSNYPISLAVMKVYSGIHKSNSVMEQKGISLEIPGGGITQEKDWYPFVMTFNDSAGFRQFIREKAGKLNLGKKDSLNN